MPISKKDTLFPPQARRLYAMMMMMMMVLVVLMVIDDDYALFPVAIPDSNPCDPCLCHCHFPAC
jgi:hypothetical protein